MKGDFTAANEQLNQRGIISICTDLYMRPQRKGNLYYVKSPVTADRHASLCLYPTTNTFVDYANGGQHGDIIGLIAYTQGCNQWDALQVLRDYYGLSSNKEGDSQKARQQIKVQQEQDRKKAERIKAFDLALSNTISRLRQWEQLYQDILDNHLREPISDAREQLLARQQHISYQLDVLCGTDTTQYPHLLPGHSSYYQWMLDCMEVLAAQGTYVATDTELATIKAQRDKLLSIGA